MNCFNHPTIVAVGTCKACAKGLCPSCAVDMGHGLSCHGEHEATVQSYYDILERNKRLIASAPRTNALGPVFTAFLGIVMVIWGLNSPKGILDFAFIIGCGFLAFAVVAYFQTRNLMIRKGRTGVTGK